jgi:hypothetical protein
MKALKLLGLVVAVGGLLVAGIAFWIAGYPFASIGKGLNWCALRLITLAMNLTEEAKEVKA